MVKVGLGRREGGPVMCGEDGGREVRSCMEREVLSFQTCHNICGSLSLELQKCCKVRGSLYLELQKCRKMRGSLSLELQTCHKTHGPLSLELQKCCKVRGSLFNLPSSCQHTYIHAYLPTGDLLMTTD